MLQMAKIAGYLWRKCALDLLLVFLLSVFACAAAKLSSVVALQLAIFEPVFLPWADPHDEPCQEFCPDTACALVSLQQTQSREVRCFHGKLHHD